jgi:hypothetical protein
MSVMPVLLPSGGASGAPARDRRGWRGAALRASAVAAATTLAAALASSCGISATGELVVSDGGLPGRVDAGGSSGSTGSSGSSGVLDATVTCENLPCAASMPAPGFVAVLMGGGADTCPAGFATSTYLESPVPAADACGCGDCQMAGTTCTTGMLTSGFDNAGTALCNQAGSTIDANGGNCSNTNLSVSAHARIDPPLAVPGTCTASSKAAPEKVASTPRKICTLAAGDCTDPLCSARAPLRACMMKEGDVECPPEAPDKHLIANDFDVACGACTCTASATCGGSFAFYADNGCSGAAGLTLQAGVCAAATNTSYSSYKWTGTVATQKCTDLTPPTASVTLKTPKTVCCPP